MDSFLTTFAAKIAYRGQLSLDVHGQMLTFDMSNPHELRYALHALTNMPYPQSDIDHALFSVFVRSGDVCLDLGANIGITALDMLACGAREVTAFEPVTALARRLQALNHPRLRVHCAAVSDTNGCADIILSQTHNQGHTLDPETVERFPKVFGDTLLKERVLTVTLDSLYPDGPAGDIWKIDVEGAELAVLRGAQHQLETSPPRVIFCECYSRVDEFLAGLGPGWVGRRAVLTLKDNALEFLSLLQTPDATIYASIAPTYVFYRSKSDALPKGLTLRL